VQEGGDDEDFGVFGLDDGGETRVVGELFEIEEGQAVNAEGMLESGVESGGIDQGNEAKLADAGKTAKIGRVDQQADAGRERDIDLGRDADQRPTCVEGDDFGNIED
jgi:hypothetical protein